MKKNLLSILLENTEDQNKQKLENAFLEFCKKMDELIQEVYYHNTKFYDGAFSSQGDALARFKKCFPEQWTAIEKVTIHNNIDMSDNISRYRSKI